MPRTALQNNRRFPRYGPLKLVSFLLLLGNLGYKMSWFLCFLGHNFTKTMPMMLKITEIVGTMKRIIWNSKKSKFSPNSAKFWPFFTKNCHFSQKCIFLKNTFFLSPLWVFMLLSWKLDMMCRNNRERKVIEHIFDFSLSFLFFALLRNKKLFIAQ